MGSPLLSLAIEGVPSTEERLVAKFADRSGLNRAHVGEIERGESNVTIQTLKIIADTLGVRIGDLVKGL